MDDSLKLPGNIVASLRHQRAKVYMKGRIFPEKGNKKQANKGVARAQKSPAILIFTGGLSDLWKENRWSVNKLPKKREEGWGAYSAFSLPFFDNPAFRASVIFITNTVFLPNPGSRDFSQSRIPSRHFAFTWFPYYPDPENTFTDHVRNRRRSCKKAKGDLISFNGIPQFDGQLYRTNHFAEGSVIQLD